MLPGDSIGDHRSRCHWEQLIIRPNRLAVRKKFLFHILVMPSHAKREGTLRNDWLRCADIEFLCAGNLRSFFFFFNFGSASL